MLTNTLSAGDKVLSPRFGQFSALWIDLAQRHGLDVEIQDEEWGTGASPERIRQALEQDKGHAIKAVMVVQNETATGVASDIAAVRRAMDAAKHPALLFVDGVSSIASIDFRMDDWGVDAAITGSQKGLMLPAGLSFVCVGQKALEAQKAARRNNPLRRPTSISTTRQRTTRKAISPTRRRSSCCAPCARRSTCCSRKGLDNVIARHHYLASGVRAAVLDGWKLKLCAKEPKWYSDTVSAVMVPEGFNGADVIKRAYFRYNLALGAGLSKVAGKLFRIGHLGDLNELMCLGAITGAEMAMRDIGIKVEPGSGAAAAEEYYRTERRAAAGAEGRGVTRPGFPRGPSMQHSIVFLDRETLGAPLRKPGFPHSYAEHEVTSPDEVVERLRDATVCITNKVPIRADALAQLPNLKLIAVAATGTDIIDKAAAAKQGVAVVNIRDYAYNTVPEHVIALMFALRRNLLAYARDVQEGKWGEARQFCFFPHAIHDIAGSTMGIIGFGAIGKAIARRAEALGMRVIAYDVFPQPGLVDLDTILRESDVITLHAPLTMRRAT